MLRNVICRVLLEEHTWAAHKTSTVCYNTLLFASCLRFSLLHFLTYLVQFCVKMCYFLLFSSSHSFCIQHLISFSSLLFHLFYSFLHLYCPSLTHHFPLLSGPFPLQPAPLRSSLPTTWQVSSAVLTWIGQPSNTWEWLNSDPPMKDLVFFW